MQVVHICMHTHTCMHIDCFQNMIVLIIFPSILKDYEPTTTTPGRKDICLPTKEMIEEMRTLPYEMLLKEFRQNSPYEDGGDTCIDFVVRETKFVQNLTGVNDSRSPLKELN